MSNDIKSTIIVMAAVMVVFVLFRLTGLGKKSNAMELTWWMAVTVAGFILGNVYVLILIILALKLFYLRSDPDRNMFFFLFLLPAIYLPVYIPFPHQSFPLLDVSQMRILSIIILVPLLPKLLEEVRHNKSRRLFLDIPLIFIFGREIVMDFQPTYAFENTLITSVKNVMGYFLEYIVPYTALAIWVNRDRRLLLAFRACILGGLILAVVAIVGGILRWDIYHDMYFSNMRIISTFLDFRGGYIRIASSMGNPITFAFYLTMVLGMVLGWLYWRRSNLLQTGLLLILVLTAMFFTGSRGGWIGAAMLLIMFFYYKMPKRTKLLTMTVILLSSLLTAVAYIKIESSRYNTNTNAEAEVDPYGTFEYRKRLFYAELAILPRYPFFGNNMYMAEPEMQDMVQGQGIIDPVNTYMTFAVYKGLIYTFFIFWIIIRSMRAITRYIESGFINNKRIRVMLGAGLAALLFANAAELVFTSFSGPIIMYFWIMLGIARGVFYITEKTPEYKFSMDDMRQPSNVRSL